MAPEGTWQIRELKDCATWYSGGTPSRSVAAYWNGEIPWISAKSLVDFYVGESEDRVTEEGVRNGTRVVPENTILFVVRGMSLKSEFRIGLTTRKVAFNQDLKALVAKDGISATFLAYAIRARTEQILGFVGEAGHGTGVLPTDRMQSLPIALPAYEEQVQIGRVAQALDFKIGLNRRINQTLEAMAQAIFKSWFVDFDPVKAKIAAKAKGRDPLRAAMGAISGKTDAELDAQQSDQLAQLAITAALFPDEMEETALGEIPKGWHVSNLGEQCAYLNRGISPKYIDEGGVLVLNQKCIRDFNLDPSKGRRHDPNQRNVSGRELPPGVVLVNSRGVGTWGRVAQVLRLDEPTIVDSHVTVARSGSKLNSAYLGQWFVTKQPEIEAIGEGSTGQTELSRGKLASMPIILPPLAVLGAFAAVLSPLQSLIANRYRESLMLQETRDALLPRLVSGYLQPTVALEGVEG